MKKKCWLSLSILLFLLACSTYQKDRRKESPHFKDGIFHNSAAPNKKKGFFTFLWMRMNTEWSKWPEWVRVNQVENVPAKVEGDAVKVSFINHASFLIQTQGLNILTDPIFSKRCSPVSFAGPKRVHQPAIDILNLPKIDLIIISHDHYDHLDMDTIEFLRKRDRPKIIAGLGVGQYFEDYPHFIELDWWEKDRFNEKLLVHFVPVQHFSGRRLTNRNTTLWGGYVLQFKNKQIYFGGDSGYGDHYQKTFEKFGAMDISFLPIGAYEPRDFMQYAHMNPKEAVMAHQDLRSKQSIGMHFGTFQLTAEPYKEPLEKLLHEKKLQKISEKDFITLDYGKIYNF
jgi:L-ascorbate metabolism protein UlaG (beta-lactamase superfamily)